MGPPCPIPSQAPRFIRGTALTRCGVGWQLDGALPLPLEAWEEEQEREHAEREAEEAQRRAEEEAKAALEAERAAKLAAPPHIKCCPLSL
jgi:hypothetical protein